MKYLLKFDDAVHSDEAVLSSDAVRCRSRAVGHARTARRAVAIAALFHEAVPTFAARHPLKFEVQHLLPRCRRCRCSVPPASLPHALVDPLVADPALKAQAPRDPDSTAEPAFPRLRATGVHLPRSSRSRAAALGRQSVGLTVAAPARVAGQADHRAVAAELFPDSGVRRFSSGPGNVPGRSGDDSLWANLRFALTIA